MKAAQLMLNISALFQHDQEKGRLSGSEKNTWLPSPPPLDLGLPIALSGSN